MSLKAKRECSKTKMITINICIYRVEKKSKSSSERSEGGHSEQKFQPRSS